MDEKINKDDINIGTSAILKKVKDAITTLEDKTNKVFFFCMDSKGTPMASVATIYEHAKILKEAGYNPVILHEKNDYTKPDSWLGEGYEDLPHASSEDNSASIGPQDFIILPEVYGGILEQLKEANCEKIIFVQAYDYILELLRPGDSWGQYGVRKAITTTDSQKKYVNSLFPTVETTKISLGLPEYFNKRKEPQSPFIAIHCRDARDTSNFIKSFYLKHPFLKWITFRDLRGMPKREFAQALKECALSVWIDPIAGFGTFPLESMKCGVPVVGLVPTLTPEWLTEDNGIWTNNKLTMVDTAAGVMKNWLEDSVPEELYKKMDETVTKYTLENETTDVIKFYNDLFNERIDELTEVLTKEAKRREDWISEPEKSKSKDSLPPEQAVIGVNPFGGAHGRITE